MSYAKLKNGNIDIYPYTSLFNDNPNVSFPSVITEDILEQFDVFEVHSTPSPIPSWFEKVFEGKPMYDGEKWVQTWYTTSLTEDEKADKISKGWKIIRDTRDGLLKECDWTQFNDSPLPEDQKKQWSEYRQKLRDIPQKNKLPFSVVWPKSPNEIEE